MSTPRTDSSHQPRAEPLGFWAGYGVFLREHKRWYLIPIALALLGLVAFVVLAKGSVAPFVYDMF